MQQYRLSDLVSGLDVTLKGDSDCLISGVAPIQCAQPGSITFLTNALYRKHLATTEASAIILTPDEAEKCAGNAVISRDPYYVYAKVAAFFSEVPMHSSGIHPTSVIDATAEVDQSASIGPHCTIGKRVKIAAGVVLGPNCAIGDDVHIGESTHLDANVVLYYKTNVGQRTHIASGTVIGGDGFGFANKSGVWHKVPQLGAVEIGHDVDIGANTTIDRGAVENTIIEDGVKLDNLIQIGHNVRIGAHTIIAGCTGVAGSTVIGRHCMIGGAAMIAGHLTIADQVMITGGAGITKSIPEPGVYSTGLGGVVTNLEFRKNNARFHRLDNFMQRVKALEAAVKQLTERQES